MEFWVRHSFVLNLVSHIEILAPHFWGLVPFIFESLRQFFKIVSFRRVWGGVCGSLPRTSKRFWHRCREEAFCPTLAFLYIYTFIHTNEISSIPVYTHGYITLFIYPRTLLYTIPLTFCFAYHEFSSYIPTNSYIRTNKSFRRRYSRGQA